jgi:DNA-binding transcriptional regulator YiaG
MEKKYKSKMLGVLHQDAVAMYEVGGITEEVMREFDRDCLVAKVPRISRPAYNTAVRRPSPVSVSTRR